MKLLNSPFTSFYLSYKGFSRIVPLTSIFYHSFDDKFIEYKKGMGIRARSILTSRYDSINDASP